MNSTRLSGIVGTIEICRPKVDNCRVGGDGIKLDNEIILEAVRHVFAVKRVTGDTG